MKYDGDTASRYAKETPDHIRVYVPLDLSKQRILAYFQAVLNHFGRASEENESAFSSTIDQVITRLEIYDQIWFTRELPETHGKTISYTKDDDDVTFRFLQNDCYAHECSIF